jgi:hypothetical protein
MLSRDDILKADDLATEEVPVPEWGGSVLVRGMTGRERDQFEASLAQQRGSQVVPNYTNARAKVVICCVVDEDGKRVFDDADIDVLGGKSGAALDRIFAAATRLSGLGERDVEDLTANFGGPNGASSSSASPATSGKPSRASSRR